MTSDLLTPEEITAKYTPEQIMESLIVMAPEGPDIFAQLVIRVQEKQPAFHKLHSLIHRLTQACIEEKRDVLLSTPPDHGKTTHIIPHLIWRLTQDPSLKIGIVCRNKELVEKHLVKIRKILISQFFKQAFPGVKPDVKRNDVGHGEWSKSKLYMEGQKEPSLEAFTLLGRAEGHRLDLLWLDDTITAECLHSEAERVRCDSAIFDTWMNRLTANGSAIVTNNAWHRSDAIHKMKASDSFTTLWVAYEGTDTLRYSIRNRPKGLHRSIPDDGILPLWAQWPERRLRLKQMANPSSYKRLFGGKTLTSEDCRFASHASWQRYDVDIQLKYDQGAIVAFLDPAGGKSAAKGDFAALTILLCHHDKTADLLNCWVARDHPDRQIDTCLDAHEFWESVNGRGIDRLCIEALPKDEIWIKSMVATRVKARRDAGRPWQVPIVFINPVEHKETRIEWIAGPIANGWLRFPSDMEDRMKEDSPSGRSWRHLVDQLEDWPFGDHDDGPDSLSGAWKNRSFGFTAGGPSIKTYRRRSELANVSELLS